MVYSDPVSYFCSENWVARKLDSLATSPRHPPFPYPLPFTSSPLVRHGFLHGVRNEVNSFWEPFKTLCSIARFSPRAKPLRHSFVVKVKTMASFSVKPLFPLNLELSTHPKVDTTVLDLLGLLFLIWYLCPRGQARGL